MDYKLSSFCHKVDDLVGLIEQNITVCSKVLHYDAADTLLETINTQHSGWVSLKYQNKPSCLK